MWGAVMVGLVISAPPVHLLLLLMHIDHLEALGRPAELHLDRENAAVQKKQVFPTCRAAVIRGSGRLKPCMPGYCCSRASQLCCSCTRFFTSSSAACSRAYSLHGMLPRCRTSDSRLL